MTEQTNIDWWPFDRKMLRRSQLIVERYDGSDGYQRHYEQRFVDRAVRDFDPVRYDALRVAQIIDGRYHDSSRELFAIIDGQHRAGMAEQLGLVYVPCDVYRHDMSYEKRAIEFYKLNHERRLVNVNDGIRALAEGKDEETLGLLYLLESHRFYLHGYRPAHVNGHRSLHATKALVDAYRQSSKALGDALDVLEPWRDGGLLNRSHERIALQALMLWCRRDDVDLARLRSVLERHGPDFIMRGARELASKTGRLNPNPAHMANALRDHYNLNLRTRRLEDAF